MKRLSAAMISVFLVLSLFACGAKADSGTSGGEEPVSVPDTAEPESDQAEPSAPSEPVGKPDTAEEADSGAEDMSSWVGKSVDTLIEAYGEPNSSEYQDSCEYPDTQDGFLYYDDFTVITIKNADGETVRTVKQP